MTPGNGERTGRTVVAPSRPSWHDIGRHYHPWPSDRTVENTNVPHHLHIGVVLYNSNPEITTWTLSTPG